MSPLRLLYVQPAEVFGGPERQAVLHISRLPRHGVEVIPVVGPGPAIRGAMAEAGITDYQFSEHLCHEPHYPIETLWAGLRFGARFTRDWLMTQQTLLRLARRHRVDVVLCSRAVGWIAASGVARALGLPSVWRAGGRITRPFEHRLLSTFGPLFRPALFLANCEAIRRQMAPLIGCPSDVLHNGVDTGVFDPQRIRRDVRAELGLPPGTPVVGMSARPAPEKGMDRLLRVIQACSRAQPAIRFLLAGEFGFRARYQEQYASAGVGPWVRFLGHVQDVPSFLAACDVVILTSNAHSIEGSPNALLEAMAMSRPVVATRVGGIGEAVTDGEEGFLLEEDDVQSFAGKLLHLLDDAPLRARMGAAGRQRILVHYDADQVTAELAHKLHEVHGQARLR
jgi:glycosyltransferase involved in cell wall biosynthesis